MKLEYTIKLVKAKLKARKRRTILTVLASSLLFGVVLSGIFISQGLVASMLSRAHNLLGDKIYIGATFSSGEFNSKTGETNSEITMKTTQRALELYENSTNENKQYPIIEMPPLAPYLDSSNPFTIQAVAEFTPLAHENAEKSLRQITNQAGGYFVEITKTYDLRGSIQSEDEDSDAIVNSRAVQNASVINNREFMSALSKTTSRDDTIQIIIPLDKAAHILGIDRPNFATANPTEDLNNFINQVSAKAIGYKFERSIAIGERTIKAPFEIVGLMPAEQTVSTLDPYDINPLLSIYKTIASPAGPTSQFTTLIANPESTAFKNIYQPNTNEITSGMPTGLVTFSNTQDAAKFIAENQCENGLDCSREKGSIVNSAEMINNTLSLETNYQTIITPLIIGIIIFIAIIAALIMTSALSRTILGEQPNVALHRAGNATSINAVQAHAAYILTLCIMIIISSFVIGGTLTIILNITSSELISANINALYGSVSPHNITIFDLNAPQILIVIGAILFTGIVCLLASFRKLRAKDITKKD